jgi:hypothetical protein
MIELLKFIAPIFVTPKSYNEMRGKLAAFLFYETWFATFFLRSIPSIDKAFNTAETYGAIGTALSTIPGHDKLNIGGLAVALVVALLTFAIRFHDRISDLFGIRRRFDRNYILLPLAIFVGAKLTPTQLTTMMANRHSIMRTVFYGYVSSRADNPLVDKHDIEQVLDAWSWYWILIEAIPLTLTAAAIAAIFKDHSLLAWFGVASIVCWLSASLYYLRLERFTRPEIEAIAADYTASLAVKAVFDAL